MTNKLLNVRIPKQLYKDAEFVAKQEGFSSVQDVARTSLREYVKKIKVQRAIIEIEKLRGSHTGIKLKSKKELEKLALKLYPQD